ncbi:MAG: potassium transporter TrkA [Deltaproteobacteria bacterium RBG_13_49_15]|nr:MAG: potassium transporter TrkA [Deltaproteobacteria bacterium RBG_13_49_15]
MITKNLPLAVLFAILIIAVGTTGYMIIEKWSFMDSIFMTVTTLSTVGYGEVNKLTQAGRIFSMLLIILGVGYFFFVAGAVVQFMMEGSIRMIFGRRKLDRQIERLRNHHIVCGYGRIGRVLCRNIRQKPIGVVVIEKQNELVPILEEDGILYVIGDASNEITLTKAGIKHAMGLIAVLGEDADNVFLTLTARQLNPDIFIMARASSEGSKAKLKAAGANHVESPYDIGAAAMAHRIIRPTVTGFLDLALAYKGTNIQMEEIPVGPHSRIANIMLKDSGIRQKYDLIIIAVKTTDGMLFNPSFETVIRPGDTVIALGGEENLKKLEAELNPQ